MLNSSLLVAGTSAENGAPDLIWAYGRVGAGAVIKFALFFFFKSHDNRERPVTSGKDRMTPGKDRVAAGNRPAPPLVDWTGPGF